MLYRKRTTTFTSHNAYHDQDVLESRTALCMLSMTLKRPCVASIISPVSEYTSTTYDAHHAQFSETLDSIPLSFHSPPRSSLWRTLVKSQPFSCNEMISWRGVSMTTASRR